MEKGQGTEPMEARLADIGTRLDRLVDTAEDTGFVAGLKSELDVWREWIDEARLQAALGRMETRDRVAEAIKVLDRLHSEIVKDLAVLEDVSEPIPGLRESIDRELRSAKEELSSPKAFTT